MTFLSKWVTRSDVTSGRWSKKHFFCEELILKFENTKISKEDLPLMHSFDLRNTLTNREPVHRLFNSQKSRLFRGMQSDLAYRVASKMSFFRHNSYPPQIFPAPAREVTVPFLFEWSVRKKIHYFPFKSNHFGRGSGPIWLSYMWLPYSA